MKSIECKLGNSGEENIKIESSFSNSYADWLWVLINLMVLKTLFKALVIMQCT